MLVPESYLRDMDTLEEAMIKYTLPLIQGEIQADYKDGLPVFVELDEFVK